MDRRHFVQLAACSVAGTELLGATSGARETGASSETQKKWGLMEQLPPDELEAIVSAAPIAYVPLGTYEHHGWHLPIGFDAVKSYALCQRTAARTGGVVLPPFFYGTGGGHVDYKWTIIVPEEQIRPILETTLHQLSLFGFKAVLILTGHYPREQVDMVHRLANDAAARNPNTRFIGHSEPEVTTPLPGDRRRGDHAAKYETSIAMALHPQWVNMQYLTDDHDPDQVTLKKTPQNERPTHDPKHPLYAIYGDDPRKTASVENGKILVAEIVERLANEVQTALTQTGS